MPWIGRKKIGFIPLWRVNARPPDVVPADWEATILRRAMNDPDPATGRDRSLRAYIRTVSSGLADLEAVVLDRRSIDRQDVPPDALEPELGARLRAEGFDAAAIVMLGGPGAGTNAGFWSRFVMLEGMGVWAMELMHGLTGFGDLYPFGDDVDPQHPTPGLYDQMDASAATHPSSYSKLGMGWIAPGTIATHRGRVSLHTLHALSLPQPPPAGQVAAVRIGGGVPYRMVELRLRADQFDGRLPAEGVVVCRVQTPDALGHRVDRRRPLVLEASGLGAGRRHVTDGGIAIHVTGMGTTAASIAIEDTSAPFDAGQLLSFADSGAPGNVSSPVVVGVGGWQAFTSVFAGRTVSGEPRLYAIDAGGRLLSFTDTGGIGNVAAPVVVGFGGWQAFLRVFAGTTGAGQHRLYAVDREGRLLSYGDTGAPGNVANPIVVGFGGWQAFTTCFGGRTTAGAHRLYATDRSGRLLSYVDAGTPGNVSNPVVVGAGGWQQLRHLSAGPDASGVPRLYAVDGDGRLLAYRDTGAPANVASPVIVGAGGWQQFRTVFAGQSRNGDARLYAVTAAARRRGPVPRPGVTG